MAKSTAQKPRQTPPQPKPVPTSPQSIRNGTGQKGKDSSQVPSCEGKNKREDSKAERGNNKRRQLQSPTGKNDGREIKPQVVLESSQEHPYIFFDTPDNAKSFAASVKCSERQWVLFTDGSFHSPVKSPSPSPSPSPPHSRSIRPMSPSASSSASASSSSSASQDDDTTLSSPYPTPPSSPSFSVTSRASFSVANAGASVVYEEPANNWVQYGFCLPGVTKSEEAELHGIGQALQLAVDGEAVINAHGRKIVILADCQPALLAIAECLKGANEDQSETAREAARKATRLRRLGVEIEMRWVPSHSKIAPNMVADSVAAQARRVCGQVMTDDRKVIPIGNPFARVRGPPQSS
ncbi:hypothetical protein BJX61DRAFT_390491 [Aspergillus egyptiacus]|nr:hypothetical protein BJX61DRAFT_390491 [Aspergillus egyptiacus]